VTVSFELRDKVALIVMDDGKANALSFAMMDEVDAAVARAEREAQAVVLAGRKGRFSAGFDLGEMMSGPDRARAMVSRGADFLLGLYMRPIPLVTACTGHALAGGALLLLTSDVRVAARGAFRIGLNEVQIGLPVPVLAMELARDRLSPAHLTAATLFSEVVDPDRALAAGWVDDLASEEEVVGAAVTQARRLSALPRHAFAKTKEALRERTVAYIKSTLTADLARLTSGS